MTIEAIGSFTLDAEVASEAIRYLLLNAGLGNGGNANIGNAVTSNNSTGVISAGNMTIGYLYEWMSVRYSDSPTGSANFSNNYANTHYIGLRNSNTQIVSENPADYVWTQVSGNGFGTTNNPYYRTTGGRDFRFAISTTAPDSTWALIPTAPTNFIDLDKVSGTIGSNGLSVFQSTIYQRATTQPTTPTGGTYNFATSVQTYPVNWYGNVPADDGRPAWASTTFYSAPYNGTANNSGWTTPVLAFQNGSNGISGTSFYEVTAYANNPTLPATPTGGQWNFNTNTGNAPTGTVTWYLTPPTTSNLWASYALATNQNGNVANLSGWTVPVQLAVTGAAGQDGLSTFQWPVFAKSVTVPATPTGGNYYFANSSNTVLPGPSGANWTSTPNAAAAQSGNGVVWISESVVSRQGTVGFNTNTPQWSTPIQYLGSNGANGIDGFNTFIWPIYQYSTTVPTTPTGGQQWDFQTANGTPPNGWYNNTSSIGNNYPIWISEAIVSGNTRYANVANTGWSTPVQWTGPQGPRGNTGANGTNAYSYGNSFQPSSILVPADYRGVPNVLPITNITYYPTVNGVAANLVTGGGGGNVLWSYSLANTGGTGGVTIANIHNSQTFISFDINACSNLSGGVTIGNVKVTLDGNISNGIEIGSPILNVNQVRSGQPPGWYEVAYPNTYPVLSLSDTANLLAAWRTTYNFTSGNYPADKTILKFDQTSNTTANFGANTLYGQWSSNSNAFVGFTSITNGNTIITGTLNTLDAAVGNGIQSLNYVATFSNGQANTTTAPQSGWLITKDGNAYIKNLFADGAGVSNVSVSSLTAGNITVVANVGNTIKIDGPNASIITYDPAQSNNFALMSAGKIATFIADPANGNVSTQYSVLSRSESGYATNNTAVTIPGLWNTAPYIMVSPNSIQTYNTSYSGQNQTISFQAKNIIPTGTNTKRYMFTPVATLSVSAGSIALAAGPNVTSTGSNVITYSFVTPSNTTVVAPNFGCWSKKSSGTLPYYNNRNYFWTAQATASGQTTQNFSGGPLELGSQSGFAFNPTLNLPTGAAWNITFKFTPGDSSGTFNGGGSNPTTTGTASYSFTKDIGNTYWYSHDLEQSKSVATGADPFPAVSDTGTISFTPAQPGGTSLTSLTANVSYSNFYGYYNGATSTTVGVWLGNATTQYAGGGAQIGSGTPYQYTTNLSSTTTIPYTVTSGTPTRVSVTIPAKDLGASANYVGVGGFARKSSFPDTYYYSQLRDALSVSQVPFSLTVTLTATWTANSAGDTVGTNWVILNGGSTTQASGSIIDNAGVLNWIAVGS